MSGYGLFRFYRRKEIVHYYMFFALFLYFLWCDFNFYGKLSSEEYTSSNSTIYISKYTVKYRILAHFSHYIYQPFCIWAEDFFSLSKIPGVTPNVVTFIHFSIAVECGRLFASSALYWRRVGVMLFCTRTMLDNLDGVIYRAQKKANVNDLVSGWGTMGFWIDGLADTLGSLFILVGTVHRFWLNPPVKKSTSILDAKARSVYNYFKRFMNNLQGKPNHLREEYSVGLIDPFAMVQHHSKLRILLIALFAALTCVLRSFMWDHFNECFHKLLGVKRADASPEKQFEVLNYRNTWLCCWLWTLNSGDAFLNFTLIAIYFNKLWDWLQFSAYAAIPTVTIVSGISYMNLVNMRNELGVSVIP